MAQDVERELGELPEDMLKVVLAMARGNPVRAREILTELNAVWWQRWLALMEQKANSDGG